MLSQHKYKLKPLLRNNRLYELAVYSGKKMLFRFRDSLNLLPGKLSSLANNLCPELGPKGSIEHDKLLSRLGKRASWIMRWRLATFVTHQLRHRSLRIKASKSGQGLRSGFNYSSYRKGGISGQVVCDGSCFQLTRDKKAVWSYPFILNGT
ncbi:UNVERIFIED_CONTAM: DNA polymerase [Sesamum calycinum]|uniref:DNA-directed DNA polymerase n=1 Tax=Sesamum calycinum TaxID=2727403 RepID=A0AAW2K8M8_9LAMI